MEWYTGEINGDTGHRFHTACVAGMNCMTRGAVHAAVTGELGGFLVDIGVDPRRRDEAGPANPCPLCREAFGDQGDIDTMVHFMWNHFQLHPERIPQTGCECRLCWRVGRGRARDYGYCVRFQGPARPQYEPRCPRHGRTLMWRNTRRPDDTDGTERRSSEWYCALPDYDPETGRNTCSFEVDDEVLRAQVPGLASVEDERRGLFCD